MPNGIHCIQSGSIGPCCMESTAFNRDPLGQAAWNPLHSIGISYIKLHGIHFIQSRYIAPLCIESTAFKHASWNPLHSIGIHWATLHGIHCIHSGSISQRCMESTALNLDACNPLLNWYELHNAAGNPLHSIGIHCSMLHGFHCIQPGYIAP